MSRVESIHTVAVGALNILKKSVDKVLNIAYNVLCKINIATQKGVQTYDNRNF